MAPVDARRKLEQIRRNKGKNKTTTDRIGKVQDLRQLISKKKPKANKPQTKTNGGRTTNTRSGNNVGPRDLRETNKKLASRRNLSQTRDNRLNSSSNSRAESAKDRFGKGSSARSTSNSNKKPVNSGGPYKAGKQIQYYIPPHLQHQQPTYIIAPAAAPQSNLAMDNVPETQGASILISNLMPSITQSEIIELFGDIGVMTAVNMINQTTALVTYQNSSDAVRAVKVYHNRLLDGKPMLVNMMPNSTPSSNVRSRVGYSSAVGGHQAPMEISYVGRRV